MAIAVIDLNELIFGIKLTFCYQFISGGKEYLVADYVKYDLADSAPTFAIWNLTDDTAGLVVATGLLAGDCYPPITSVDLLTGGGVLANGNLGIVTRGYYIELDLINKNIEFSKRLLCDPFATNWLCQGTTGHVIIAQGGDEDNLHLEWCEPGGTNWDGVTLATPTTGLTNRFPCSAPATDGDNYAFCGQFDPCFIIAVNMRTKEETHLDFGSTNAVSLQQHLIGGVGKIYAEQSGVGWFLLDGKTTPAPTSAPSSSTLYHTIIYDPVYWFASDVITVDKTNIMPNSSNEVSVSYDKGAGLITKTLSPITTLSLIPRTFSPPHPDGYSLIQGGNYGPHYKFNAAADTATILGYKDTNSNTYEDRWSPNQQTWWLIGYDKRVNAFNPSNSWTMTPLSSTTEIVTTNPAYKDPVSLGFSGGHDHFIAPATEAINKKVYFCIRQHPHLIWYDLTLDTFGQIDFVTAFGIEYSYIFSIKAIMGGHFLAISSSDQDVVAGAWTGRLRLFHVPSHTFTKTFTPDASIDDIGVICEVGVSQSNIGHVIAVRGNRATGCKAWKINTCEVGSSAIVWSVNITGNALNRGTSGTDEFSNIEMGPDGFVYFYIDTDIYKLNPTNGALTKVVDHTGPPAAPPNAPQLRWIGNNLYAYNGSSNTHLYKITGLI